MARRQRRSHSTEKKIAAVEEVNSGAKVNDVLAKYNIVSSVLARWREKHVSGELAAKLSRKNGKGNGHAPVKAREHLPDAMTPERVFGERVREAIAMLRRAEKEVERMKEKGTLKEADTAHLYAGLALRMLQGDNGT